MVLEETKKGGSEFFSTKKKGAKDFLRKTSQTYYAIYFLKI